MSELIIFLVGCIVGAISLYVYAKVTIALAVIAHHRKQRSDEHGELPEYVIEHHSGQYMAYHATTGKFTAQGSTIAALVERLSESGACNVMSDNPEIIQSLKNIVKEQQ